MSWIYADSVLKHYKKPHNFRKMAQPCSEGHDANQECGDEITVYARVNASKVKDASFQGTGCALMIASASMLTKKVKGKMARDAAKLGKEDIIKMLGVSLTPARLKCATLPLNALKKAL